MFQNDLFYKQTTQISTNARLNLTDIKFKMKLSLYNSGDE